jgi:hypothetical protein
MTQPPDSTVLHVAGIGRGVSRPLTIEEAHELLMPDDMASTIVELSLSVEARDVLLRLARPLDVVMRDAFLPGRRA